MRRIKIFCKNVFKLMKKNLLFSMLPFILAVFVVGIIAIGFVKAALITASVIVILIIIEFISRRKPKKKPEKNVKHVKEEKKSKDKKVKDTKTKKKKRRVLHILFNIMLIGIIICILAVAAFVAYIVTTAPEFDPNDLYKKEASIMYDTKGNEITKLGAEIRDKISYDDMPQVLIDAIIATEDSRFNQHNGFDLPRFLKASLGQAMGNSSAGGASTITMQVVKNNITSLKQTITRKFTDIYMAMFVLEKKYSKEEIMEFYVNAPFLGANSYGIAEASRNYFGKEIKDINLSEAAFLAGLFQAPGYYGDSAWSTPERAEKRRNTVLYLMKRHGYINKEEEKIANSIPVSSLLKAKDSKVSENMAFIDMVIEEIYRKTGNSPNTVPMLIYTTLDPDKQQHLNNVVNGNGYTWINDAVQTGVAVTNVNTGAIVAMSGGRNITVERPFNRALDIKRQPGSTAKPIFDYGPGIENENWSTYTPFLDDEYSYSNGKVINNWDDKYMGLLTLKQSLGLSRNIPALKAFQANNNKNILNFATSLGIKPEVEGGYVHEAHSIGAFNGTNPVEMAAAYSAFANGGYYIEPYTVSKITYMDSGESKEFAPVKNKVMEDSTAYLITNSLIWSVESGISGGAGRVSGYQVAAKTGTTNFDTDFLRANNLPGTAVNDLWAVGYSADYCTALWYGYDSTTKETVSKKYYSTGADNSRKDKLFNTIIKGIVPGGKKAFDIPKSVIAVEVEKETIPGSLPSEFTPSDMRITEYFKKGAEPTTVSDRYKALSNVKNLKAEEKGNKIKLSWDTIETPTYYTDAYMTSFFNQYYGKQSQKYMQRHKDNISTKMGIIGYDVYYKDSSGFIHSLGTTTTNNMEINKPQSNGNVTFIVKTAFSIFKNNASSGTEFLFLNEFIAPVIEGPFQNITLYVGDDSNYSSDISSIVVIDNGVPVTDSTKVNITVEVKKGTTIVTLPIEVSDANIGLYNVKYTIEYKGATYTKSKTVEIKKRS